MTVSAAEPAAAVLWSQPVPPASGFVLLVDRADVLGRVDVPVAGEPSVDAAVTHLNAARPDAPLFIVRTATDAAPMRRAPSVPRGRPRHVLSAFHTDARRLQDVGAQRFAHVLVARPAVALLPTEVVCEALDLATRQDADLLEIDGVSDEVAYVTSARLLRAVLRLGAVPGARTLPSIVERLQRADPSVVLPWTVERVARPRGLIVPVSLPTMPADHATAVLPTTPRDIVIALPSPYQTGAHFAWRALLDHLDRSRVAFVVARDSGLARALVARRFETMLVKPGWLASADALVDWTAALDVLRPTVVHLDGAECGPLAAPARQRGARVVTHVRLMTVERFLPLCAQADAVVAVSADLRERLERALAGAVVVAHVPDGVSVGTGRRTPTAGTRRHAFDDRPVRLLCVGRVEPSKDQLRVLDIAAALAARRPCELRLIGPCGHDVAYADEVTTRIRALPGPTRAVWLPFADSMAPHYRWADVVLVASRSEALGMVGLEALAAGRLLVAQRSSGYEAILDPHAGEGLLFERDEPAPRIAARIDAALATYAAYAESARRKARTHFDARSCVARLATIWDLERQP